MPIDANILFQAGRPTVQLDDPMNKLAQLGQVQGFQNQNALAQLQLKQAQQQDQDRTAMANAYQGAVDPATGRVDYAKVTGNLAGAGAGAAIPAVQKSAAEAQKAQLEMQKEKLARGLQQLEIGGQIMAGVKDQATYDQAKQQAANIFGQDFVANWAPNYDPATVEANKAKALSMKDQMEQANKQLDYQLNVRKQTEVERNNQAQNKVAQGQLGVAQGQLGVAQQRLAYDQSQPKGVYDKDNGIIVDPRTGKSIAVTDQNGQPVQGGGKLTEDQGKATGWLIQAENAYKNIKDAVKSNPSALKPGVNDLIASVPSFGFGEVVANNLRGADRQRVLQGTSALSEALLRAATGAGVNESEARQKVNELTPVSGDSDAVIAQKMASIPLYIDSLKVRAGPGAKKASEVLSKQPAAAAPSASSDGWSVTQVK